MRLIHATIRNLLLRGSPENALLALGGQHHVTGAGELPALRRPECATLYQALWAHGWKVGEDGLPCNQEELAYTLLTFSYVFLRSMRRLGLGLPASDEEAYLHAWNVVRHVLGIRRELLADTMD
ncbi:oxygenase MpaB family protein [Rhodoferax sp. PAMC 29310]|uniref:oxygenase MpaB family protein n=1 Tax=Rhodoferax sp. PAMC 29310 TaxID=2822760 RepID=UPI001B3419B2|nr:oxygenase MpaB family protein [Rhodoferax sp. PAMC 29310]